MIKVLIVDDDKLVRKGLISAMPWHDFDMQIVGEASNGEKALEFLEANSVDLLLTDLAMPVMSGIELMRVVHERLPHIFMVVLTLHQDFELVQEALRLGAIDYIAKVQFEKENFDEILKGISKRMLHDKKFNESQELNLHGKGIYTSNLGYALYSSCPESDSRWVKEMRLHAGIGIVEVDHDLWLCVPAENQDSSSVLEQLSRAISTKSDWAVIQLHGFQGRSQTDVHRGLREYKEKALFYEYDPNKSIYSMSFEEWNEPQPVSSEEYVNVFKSQWSSHEWIHNESLFRKFILELKLLKLPQAKMLGLLYSLVDEWNRVFYPVVMVKIKLRDSFDFWHQVEAWFYDIRDTIIHAIGKPSFSSEVVDCILRAVRMVNEEMKQEVTAADLAKRVNLSRSYFSHCFKEIVGKTFNDYLRQVRIEQAKEYLMNTNKTISWIAENTGYLDEKYFSRLFREQTGILPSEFRQTNRLGREMSDH